MRYVVAVAAGLMLVPAGSRAQRPPEVTVQLRQSTTAPQADVRLRGLLTDQRFVRAMQSGFPLYVEYRVVLKEEKANWFDRSVIETTWEVVAYYDPVRDRYVVEDFETSAELDDLNALGERLDRRLGFLLTPDGAGTFYFQASVSARTLSDEDVDEVFDWLKGDADSSAVGRRGLVTRTARRLLVQVAPLPRFSRDARTATFRWPQ